MRRLRATKLVVASHNRGKIIEITQLLKNFNIETIGADALGLDEPEETGDSFVANAKLKAQAAASASNLPALADDSGLAVDALGGAPGIYSARWAEKKDGTRDFVFAMEKVIKKLQLAGHYNKADNKADNKKRPRARFICALALAWPDGHVEMFEGKVEGTLVWPMRGQNGFGYDPIFLPLLPAGGNLTFGEMPPADKHAISHRADAFAQLVEACFVA